MKRSGSTLATTIGLVIITSGCSDSRLPTQPGLAPDAAPSTSASARRWSLGRYVAIGTSVTMGVQSDGVFAGSQRQSWAVQLAALAGQRLSLPLISGYGCGSPLTAPLSTFGRTRPGENTFTPFDSRQCDASANGVTLPAANVAVDGATTLDALQGTSATKTGLRGQQYARVLAPGQTQVSAMLAQQPEFVSIELGANDIMGARNGFYQQGVTVFPLNVWKTLYANVVAAVPQGTRGILVGLIDDAMEFPAFRTGLEIFSQTAQFRQAFNVEVDARCGAEDAQNVLFVPARVIVPVMQGLTRRQAGLDAARLSCANDPRNLVTQPDFALTPADIHAVNLHLAEMNAFIRQQAEARGFAYVELEAIYGRRNAKPPFDIVALMNSRNPYGPYVSRDGIHPNGLGSAILAVAAAKALIKTYRLRIDAVDEHLIADDDDR